jgi:hypothetical protein
MRTMSPTRKVRHRPPARERVSFRTRLSCAHHRALLFWLLYAEGRY